MILNSLPSVRRASSHFHLCAVLCPGFPDDFDFYKGRVPPTEDGRAGSRRTNPEAGQKKKDGKATEKNNGHVRQFFPETWLFSAVVVG